MLPRKCVQARAIALTVVWLPLLFVLLAPKCSEGGSPPTSGDRSGDDLSAVRSALRQRIQGERWTAGSDAGSTCGIYAACRSLSLLGIDVDPGLFFTVDYMASGEGSTPAEVVKIIESQRCQAVPIVNLSKLDVMLLGCPVIANLRATPGATAFDHWACVVWENHRLLVFDGAVGPVEMSFADFLPLWNGYGVVVSHSRQPVVAYVWLVRFGVLCGFVLIGVSCWRVMSWLPLQRVRDVARLSAACLALSLAGNLVFGDITRAIHGVRTAVAPSESALPRAGLTELRTAAVGRKYVLIDARGQSGYEFGAVELAVNVPHGISLFALKGLFEGIDRDTPFLVYCQSARCNWNAALADKFKLLGFRDVTVSDVGWVEYTATTRNSEGRPHATESPP
jgi:rhodanese-related sulfurtransferase